VDNKFFAKNKENLRAKHLKGGSQKGGGPRQVPRSPPRKNTPLLGGLFGGLSPPKTPVATGLYW